MPLAVILAVAMFTPADLQNWETSVDAALAACETIQCELDAVAELDAIDELDEVPEPIYMRHGNVMLDQYGSVVEN